MTTVIHEDKDWLKMQVSEAVDFVVEKQLDTIKGFLIRNLMEQLYFMGCLEHQNNHSRQPGKLVIEIDLPNSEDCGKILDHVESFEDGVTV